MKICFPCDSSQTLGGGWTFRRNMARAVTQLGHTVVEGLDADIALIAGTTMVTKETMWALQKNKTKIVVRLDNVPRNSRNRNTGTARLKSFSDMADAVVYQCNWAKDYLFGFISKDGPVIYNGVDTEIFSPEGANIDFKVPKEQVYLYSRYNRDETKNWEVAWYEFQQIAKRNPNALLVLVGQFSPEQQAYNFDFFRGEKINFQGIIDDPRRMAMIMRGCGNLLATYYNDCFSNTYLEALQCGMDLVKVNLSGGTPEMLDLWQEKGAEYFTLKRMAMDYLQLFENLLL